MLPDPDEIARAVIGQFELLPSKRKPLTRPNGVLEWVPLAGIVAQLGDGRLRCLSLGTGMKCLPATKLPYIQGCALHDWHAEIVALRAFNHLLLEECKALLSGREESDLLARRTMEERQSGYGGWTGQPFAFKDNVALYMYCSEAPCGDASMELTMVSQQDATPWLPPSGQAEQDGPNPTPSLPGREFFSQLGIVRRKPARRDAPISMSKSCSDKLALKQCTSLLASIPSLLVAPSPATYLRALVLPSGQVCTAACLRAFSADEGRMKSIEKVWTGGYTFQSLQVLGTQEEFALSKLAVRQRASEAGVAAFGGATAWNCSGLEESLEGGVVRGIRGYTAKSASKLSRIKSWKLASRVANLLGEGDQVKRHIVAGSYGQLKEGALLQARKRVKEHVFRTALVGWVRNRGDDDFGAAG